LFNLIKPIQVYRHYVLCAVAELERSLIVERVKAGLRNARTKGKRLGRPRKILDTKRIAARRAQGVGWKRITAEMGVGTIYRVTLEVPKLGKRILEPRQVCELADLFRSD
jgi:DNA invertase Pin-like site-specific DNA recombinase